MRAESRTARRSCATLNIGIGGENSSHCRYVDEKGPAVAVLSIDDRGQDFLPHAHTLRELIPAVSIIDECILLGGDSRMISRICSNCSAEHQPEENCR